MKILACLLVSLDSFGQCLIDTIYHYEMKYDENNNSPSIHRRDLLFYNSSGKIIEEIEQNKIDFQSWSTFRKIKYSYNSENLLVEVASQDNLNPGNRFIRKLSYNDKGRAIFESNLSYRADTIGYYSIDSFEYDNADKLITNKKFYLRDNELILSSFITYTYDAQNNLIEESYSYKSDTGFYVKTRILYNYDANSNVYEKLSLNINNQVWKPSSLSSFTYHTTGEVQAEVNGFWIRDTFKNWVKIEYSYNANLLSKREYYKWRNNSWILNFHTDFIQESNNWTNEMEFGYDSDSMYLHQYGKQYHCRNFNTSTKNSNYIEEPFLKYYNNKELYIQGDTYNINFEIFSLDGNRVNMGKLTESSNIIRIDQLKQGIYFLKFNNQIRPYQFIKTDQ